MHTHNWLRRLCALSFLAICILAGASEHHGQVTFGGLPLPGATVTATQGDRKFVAITDQQGVYSFPDLTDGSWTIEVEMQCFSTIKQDVTVGPTAQGTTWELKLLPLDQIKGQTTTVAAQPPTAPQAPKEQAAKDRPKPENPPPAAAPSQEEANQNAADGFLINGSQNNGAASPFAQLAAFGNARNAGKGLYHGGIGFRLDNSALDARPFSLSGLDTPKASYNRVSGAVTLGGPLKIPHLFRHGPNFFVSYQWTRDRNASIQSALVPDLAERQGDFSHELNAQGQPVQIFNPATGLPFAGTVPVSPQAQALLNLYPTPNVTGNPRYNFQTPIISNTHQDAMQSRLDKTIGHKDELYGGFSFQSTRTDSPNLFGFLDTTDALGMNTNINWSHRFTQRVAINLGYRFSRLATRITPFWENRENISGEAGITGNNQDPMNWGPPSLIFSSGTAGLSDGQSSSDRNQTNTLTYSLSWNHNRHYFTFGGDFRRQEFNYLSQQNPRGTLAFTGAATQGVVSGVPTGGSALADFILGIPDTSAIAFGNADKYFRESVYSAYFTDDWRINPQLSLNAGVRWEYGAPITELFDRLVNLDIAPGFIAAAPVVASNPTGPLTGETYPSSLINPDKRIFEPRIGIAWRPLSGSSLLVRAGYGIYSDTSVYQTLALQMAQQAPLSKSLSVQNSPVCPLTLANPFNACPANTQDTFGIDPNFRVGYVQTWQLSVQRDLRGSLQLVATYLGNKGSHGMQEFLPNTFPIGAVNPCLACPLGFAEFISNGTSTRESGQLQLRRRLHNGLTATVQYTFSKSIDDDAALGGQSAPQSAQQNPFSFGASTGPGATSIAQNWLNLKAERGPSTFDQRHLLNAQIQYTTGMGMAGGTLLSGWRGTLLKGWTFLTQIAAGSGLPETPIFLAAVPGTGVTGSIRPDVTSASIHAAPSGLFLNPAAFTAPAPGQWGNAGRNSIVGPAVFSWNGSISRAFLLDGRYNLEFRLESTNFLNHPTFTSWNTIINSSQFGLPATANSMRNVLLTGSLRF